MAIDFLTRLYNDYTPYVQPQLLFTIGIARCGKSTYCDKWALTEGNRTIVSGDDIRLAMHGERFNRDAEPMVWAIHTYMIKALLLRGFDVIIDGTNTTEKSIHRILSIKPDARYILIDTPIEECKRRASASGQGDLVTDGVIDRQSAQLEALKAEGIEVVVDRVRQQVINRWKKL